MGDTNTIDRPAAPLHHMWLVPLSVLLFILSLFFLFQSVAFLRWMTKDEEEAPNPRAGVLLCLLLVLAEFAFFYGSWLSSLPSLEFEANLENDHPLAFFIVYLLPFFPLRDSVSFARSLFIGSAGCGLIAMFKFSMAGVIAHRNGSSSSPSRSPLVLMVAIFFNLIQLVGSFASIFGYIR